MKQVVDFYMQNKTVIDILITIAIYVIAHRKAALAFVSHKTSYAMFGIEKQAELLLLNTGGDKMKKVEDLVYGKLPGWVRIVVSPDQFRKIAQKFFDQSKMFVEQNAKPASLPEKQVNPPQPPTA